MTTTLLVVALAVLFVFRWRREGFNWGDFAATFAELRWGWLGAAAALSVASYFGRALRWAIFIRPLRPDVSVWRLFSATAIGFTAIVIFGRPGEVVRPYLIAVKEKVPFSSQAAAWILERIYDLLAALLIFGFALARIGHSGMHVGPRLEWILKTGGYFVAIIGVICLIILTFLHLYGEVMRRRLLDAISILPPAYHRKAEHLVSAFVEGAQATRQPSALAKVIGYTFLEWGIIAACQFCLFRAFPDLAGFRLTDILIFLGFVAFGSIVQIPGVGGGMQLVAIFVLTELFHVPLELASSLAIVLWLVAFVVIVPFGVFLLFREGLNWKKIKEMEAEASV